MIFNKDSAGAKELKALLGFIYKSNNFDNLISFIAFAENDLRKVISSEVFDLAESHYKSSNFSISPVTDHPEYFILDKLVSSIQLPVALHAYRRYAVQNDLAHSDKGRTIIVTNEEKPAFEWMIDKSDRSLLEIAHEATDLLLEFLDKNAATTYVTSIPGGLPGNPPISSTLILLPWAASAQFKLIRELFITKDQFDNEFSIGGSRRVFLAISPFIRSVQKNEIFASLGIVKYDLVKAELLSGTVSSEIEALLGKIRPALAFIALSKDVLRLSIEVLPNGIFTNFITGTINSKSAAADPVRVQVSNLLNSQGLADMAKLQDYLSRLIIESAGGTVTPASITDRIDPTLKYVRF
ncbi:MAG: DUF6712 family protein [Bacteroidota bacterium]